MTMHMSFWQNYGSEVIWLSAGLGLMIVWAIVRRWRDY